MSVLLVTGLKKILGSQEILRGADLRLDHGEKTGCVGRNGEGKTTLLRIVEGEEHADSGSVLLAKGARIGYVAQRPAFDAGVTVRGYVEGGLAEVHAVERELESVGEHMAEVEGDALDALVKRHGELTARMEFLGGWESERRVETVLGGIGLAPHLWDREASSLSGGEKSRTAMARELVSVPDLLLLDEPTNHLDLAGIEWLEDWLRSIASAVLLVSHDRRLLDNVASSIIEVQGGTITRYPGNHARYVELKEERYSTAYRAWEQQQDLIRREESFIKKHMGSQRTAEAKGRRKRLQNVERLPQPFNDVRRPIIRVAKAERGGEEVLSVEGFTVGHDSKALLEGLDLRIGRGERIGLVGPNGTGKTTLMRALAGRAEPLAGELKKGYKAACGYYDQETSDLRDDGTPYSEIKRDHPKMTDLEVRSHLARFLFRGDEIDLTVSGLSGGERARLALARLVLQEPSWLALDEPTNHLDLAGRTALEEMLSGFHGAILCITHDREFLDRICNRIWLIGDGTLRDFRGNYSEMRTELRAENEERARIASERDARRKQAERKEAERKQERAVRDDKPRKPKKAKNPWALEKLEKAIMSLEERKSELMEALGKEEVYKDPGATRDVQMELAEVERDLEHKNGEWEEWAS